MLAGFIVLVQQPVLAREPTLSVLALQTCHDSVSPILDETIMTSEGTLATETLAGKRCGLLHAVALESCSLENTFPASDGRADSRLRHPRTSGVAAEAAS